MQKQMILTSKWHGEQPFAGQNTQHILVDRTTTRFVFSSDMTDFFQGFFYTIININI